jgi:uncharacterized protein YjbK
MEQQIEIEFKTLISKEKYLELLELLDLKNSIFTQTNYYFDTINKELINQHKIIRIRQKPMSLKLTLKEALDFGHNVEKSIMIEDKTKEQLINEGFNTKKYYGNLDYDVIFITSLVNNRAKTSYLSGTLFLDECVYNGITDYEIEYEASSFETGTKEWNLLLSKLNVTAVVTNKKTTRAFESIK